MILNPWRQSKLLFDTLSYLLGEFCRASSFARFIGDIAVHPSQSSRISYDLCRKPLREIKLKRKTVDELAKSLPGSSVALSTLHMIHSSTSNQRMKMSWIFTIIIVHLVKAKTAY